MEICTQILLKRFSVNYTLASLIVILVALASRRLNQFFMLSIQVQTLSAHFPSFLPRRLQRSIYFLRKKTSVNPTFFQQKFKSSFSIVSRSDRPCMNTVKGWTEF